MPYLYCEQHGKEREAGIIEREEEYRRADESVLVVTGTLVSGPWLCDSCNAELQRGDTATLISAFPGHCRDDIHDYDFGYESAYFAMRTTGRVNVYGAEWPDDAIKQRLTRLAGAAVPQAITRPPKKT